MEVLVFGGLFFILGGFVLMGLSLAFAIIVWLVALVLVGLQAVWRGLTR